MQRTSAELLHFIFYSIGEVNKSHGDEKLYKLSEMGRDIVFSDRCTIWILDEDKHTLWTKVAQEVGNIVIKDDYGLVGAVVQSGEPLIENEVYLDTRFNTEIDKKTGYMTKTMMVIPMKNNQGKVIGAIQVINKKENLDFTTEDMNQLKLVSSYVSESIHSLMLLKEVDDTQKELVHILGTVGENRSNETGKHVKRVALYTRLLAELYGMDSKEVTLLCEAAPMHDIGKLAIPDSILHKPGALNDEEWEIMKTHASIGYEMFNTSKGKLLKAAAIIANEHHEKYDGTGYPRGLAGEEIHIYGRIVALVDVFDALNSKRVYKDAWDIDKIFEYIKLQKCKHFDPELAELLLSNKERFIAIHEANRD